MTNKVSNKCVEIVKHYESLHDGDLRKIGLQPKLCPANIVTIGYGYALTDRNGKFLKGQDGMKQAAILYPEFMTITEEKACELLNKVLNEYSAKVLAILKKIGVDLTQDQFDALVSLCYNCGTGCIINNKGVVLTIGKVLKNKNRKPEDITKAFLLWNKGGGKVLKGLTYRRQTESNLFNTGEVKIYN